MRMFKAEDGMSIDATDTMYPSRLSVHGKTTHISTRTSTHYGYVLSSAGGPVHADHKGGTFILSEGGFFAVPGPASLTIPEGSLVVLIERIGYRAQLCAGAIEEKGRLSYIDGCSDSMLAYPARLGDPVFNHLHFPRGIVQSQHTHPTIRLGIVAKGKGAAWQRKDESHQGWEHDLVAGNVFLLDEQELHSFRTDKHEQTMDVIAYHPDSDWGPTDTAHPMLNRTYMGSMPGARGALSMTSRVASRTLKTKETEQTVYELALERIARCYDRFDTVAVSFSGGKDSTVCLNLALEVARKRGRLPLHVIHWDEEAIPPETVDYVARVQKLPDVDLRWFCFPVKHRNACSTKQPFWHPWAPEDKELWCRPLPEGAITEIPGAPRDGIPLLNRYIFPPERYGRVAIIMGIRADESMRRRQSVTKRVHDNWISVDSEAEHISLAKVIYDWRTPDVWAAPKRFNWDYNTTYDLLDKLGVSIPQQRVAPPFGQEPFQRLWHYAQLWPELWEKMLLRVDGAPAAGRYSRSPLYGFGVKLDKPEDMSWETAVKHALAKWPPNQQKAIAHRLRLLIERHNRDTNNAPLPEKAKYGLSWAFLYKLAISGDLKNRKNFIYDMVAWHAGEIGSAGSNRVRES